MNAYDPDAFGVPPPPPSLGDVLVSTIQAFLVDEATVVLQYPISRAHLIYKVQPLLKEEEEKSYGVLHTIYRLASKRHPLDLWSGLSPLLIKNGADHAATTLFSLAETTLGFDISTLTASLGNPYVRVGANLMLGGVVTSLLLVPGYPLQTVYTCMAVDGLSEKPRNLSIADWLRRITTSSFRYETEDGDEEEVSETDVSRLFSGIFLQASEFVLDRFLQEISTQALVSFISQHRLSPTAIELAVGGSAVLTRLVLFPLTTVSTRLMAQHILDEDDERRYDGVVDCVRKIYQDEGVFAFYRGWLAPVTTELALQFLLY